MKIVFYEMSAWEAEYIRGKLKGHEVITHVGQLNDAMAVEPDADIISTFTHSKVTLKLLEACQEIKLIATRTTGFDHIDIDVCKTRGVLVSNVPTYGDNTVAEFTFALLLAMSRKLYPSIKRVREQALFNFDALRGFDLKGKNIGIIGTGHIGACVARIAQGFSMRLLGYDPYPNEQLAQESHLLYLSLDELLRQSDVITLHVPYMPSTHHLINKKNIHQIKRGAVLVNTARGGLVETTALVEALRGGILSGAALDVLEEEGFLKEEAELLNAGHPSEAQLKTVLADHELMSMDNVLVTPHNAFHTSEAIQRILDTTAENILAFIGGSPTNVVGR